MQQLLTGKFLQIIRNCWRHFSNVCVIGDPRKGHRSISQIKLVQKHAFHVHCLCQKCVANTFDLLPSRPHPRPIQRRCTLTDLRGLSSLPLQLCRPRPDVGSAIRRMYPTPGWLRPALPSLRHRSCRRPQTATAARSTLELLYSSQAERIGRD